MQTSAFRPQELENLSPDEQIKNLKRLTAIKLIRVLSQPDLHYSELKKAFGREISEMVVKGVNSITHVFNVCGANKDIYTCYMPYSGMPEDVTFIGQNGTNLVVVHIRIAAEDPDEWLCAVTNAQAQQEELTKRAVSLYTTWRLHLKGNAAYRWAIPVIPDMAHFVSLVPGDTWEKAKHVSVRLPDMKSLLPPEVLVGVELESNSK